MAMVISLLLAFLLPITDRKTAAHITPNTAPEAPIEKCILLGSITCDRFMDISPDTIPETKYMMVIRREPSFFSTVEPNMNSANIFPTK